MSVDQVDLLVGERMKDSPPTRRFKIFSRPSSSAAEKSAVRASARMLNFVPSTSASQANVSTMNGRLASCSTSNMASPEILTRRVFLEKIEGYSNLAPELSHTVVPSLKVTDMLCPLGAVMAIMSRVRYSRIRSAR